MWNQLSLRDLLLIAEETLGVPYGTLERAVCTYRAESALAAPFVRIGGALLFPDPGEQAGICALQLVRSRPLPFGNRRVAFECMLEMLIRSGQPRLSASADEIGETFSRLQAGRLSGWEFLAWVEDRVTA